MYNLLYQLYFLKFKNRKLDALFVRIIVRVVNIFVPIHFYCTRFLSSNSIKSEEKCNNKNELFIVSLTSFPKRINRVWLTIETILRQDVKPDKLILWLYEGEFDGKESLPKSLLLQEKRGLEIRFCKENILPHKKYFYTMQEFPKANVITIDDDMFYPPDLIFKLIKFHKSYPNSIICPITRQIKKTDNILESYGNWPYLRETSPPDIRNLTMGGGGTLFPPGSLHVDLFDLNWLIKLSLKADDLWLKVMSIRNNTKVVSIAGEYPLFFIPVIYRSNTELMETNIGEGQNDQIFASLLNYYQIPIAIFNDNFE